MAAESARLVVLSRDGCHLCEQMIEALRPLQSETAFELEVRDIDDDPELLRRYAERVPVLLAGDTELCRYRLDLGAVNAWLANFR